MIVDADDPYPGCLRLGDLMQAVDEGDAIDAGRTAVGPDDPFTILYTSGTT